MTDSIYAIRNVPPETRARLGRNSRIRGITIGAYLTALADLHDSMRAIADSDVYEAVHVGAALKDLGLQTVTG